MYVHREKKIAFIAHPKTASSSTSHVLVQELGFVPEGSHHQIDEAMLTDPHDPWAVISTVRQPLDTLVSWYFHFKKHHPGLPAFPVWARTFVASNTFVARRMFFGLEITTHALVYERLQKDWDVVCEELGLAQRELPHRNVGNVDKVPYKDFYNDPSMPSALMNRIVEKFEQDILDHSSLLGI